MHFDELPSPVPGMRLWGAKVGKHHFVITHEDGQNCRPGNHAEWVGYTASLSIEGHSAEATRIEGLWQSFTAAEKACQDAWRQLRVQN